MIDDRLSDVGNDQLDELAPDADPLTHRLLDSTRYHLLVLVQLFQTITAIAMLLSGLLFLGTQSIRFASPFAINGAAFLLAYALNDVLTSGWWWWTDG